MATGNEVLAYQGNAALGLGTDVPYYGEAETKILDNIAQYAAQTNILKNKEKYDKKIKDRDEALGLLTSGKLQINKVLPGDRPELQRQIDEIKKLIIDNNGDIKSNPEVWFDVNSKIDKFKEDNILATSKMLQIGAMDLEIAETKRPDIRDKYIEHRNKWEKEDFHTPVQPYQNSLDYTIADASVWDDNGREAMETAEAKYDTKGQLLVAADGGDGINEQTGTTGKTKKGAALPANDFYSVTKTPSADGFTEVQTGIVDYNKIKQYATLKYTKNDGTGSWYATNKAMAEIFGGDKTGEVRNLVNTQTEKYRSTILLPQIEETENRIKSILAAIPNLKKKEDIEKYQDAVQTLSERLTELKNNDSELSKQIQFEIDPETGEIARDKDGNLKSNHTPLELKAKFSLAKSPTFKTSSTVVNKDAASIAKTKSEIAENQAQALKYKSDAVSNRIKADADAKKKAAEIRNINNKTEQEKEKSTYYQTETDRLFENSKPETSGENIITKISPLQIEYIAAASNVEVSDISEIKADYTDPENPVLTVITKAGKDPKTNPSITATIRPGDVLGGIAEKLELKGEKIKGGILNKIKKVITPKPKKIVVPGL